MEEDFELKRIELAYNYSKAAFSLIYEYKSTILWTKNKT